MAYNGVQIDNSPNIIVITDSDANQITVTQPLTRTVEVSALGPQGPKGDSVPFIQIGTTNTWYTTSDIEITGSLTVSGSNTFTNIGTGIFSGSLVITGSALYNGNELLTTAITGGYVTTASFDAFSASYAVDSASFDTRILINSSSITILSGSFLTLSGSFLVASASFDSRINLLSASFQSLSSSYVTTSGSVSTRLSSLEQFSSSLDATFATDAQLNAATASLSSSIAALSSSYLVSSASFDTRINSIASGSEQLSGSLAGYTTTSSFNSFTSSYKTDSASFDTRILSNSSSIALLSGSFLITSSSFQSRITSNSASIAALSGSYLSDSSSFAQRITSTSGSLAILSGSFQSFSGSYNTGSFTGSFAGQGTFDNLNATTATITGNVTVLGTASINTLIVNQTQLSTGSNQLGDAANDTQTLFGTVRIPTGSLTVTGSSFFTGSLNLGTGTVLYGDTINSSLILDQTTGAYLKYGATSEIGLLGSITRLRAANSIQLQTSTTTHLFVSSSGNVGIGTTTPATKLHVGEGSGATVDTAYQIVADGPGITGVQILSGTTQSGRLVFGDSAANNAGMLKYDHSNDSMAINTALSERLRITSVGNVGIGITNPSSSIHAVGSNPYLTLQGSDASYTNAAVQLIANGTTGQRGLGIFMYQSGSKAEWFSGNPYSNADSFIIGRRSNADSGSFVSTPPGITAQTGYAYLTIGNTGNIGIGTASPSQKLDVVGNIKLSNNSQLMWRNAADNGDIPILQLTNTNDLNIGTTSSSIPSRIRLYTSSTERLRILSTGEVGIGTISPTARLQVKGSGTTSSTTAFRVENSNASSSLVVLDDGNVGIGTTTPDRLVHISSSVGNALRIDNVGSGQNAIFIGNISSLIRWSNGSYFSNTGMYSGGDDQGYLTFDGANVQTRLSIKANTGNIGIGTTTQTSRLQVKGSGTTSATTAFRVENSNASGSMVVLDNGNVGIGTATPNSRLTVIDSTNTVAASFGGGAASPGTVGIGTANSGVRPFIQAYTGGGSSTDLTLQPNAGTSVGIGTTSPAATLHLSGRSGSALLRVDSDASSSILFVTGSGRVGVNTLSPVTTFDVMDHSNVVSSIPIASFRTSGSTGHISLFNYITPFEVVRIQSSNDISSGGSLRLYTLNSGTMTEKFRITNDGQTYIGTGGVIPTARLQVRGIGSTSATTTFTLQNSSASPSFTVTDDLNSRFFGNVGVGTTPSASLHVFGTTLLSGSAGTGSALTVYKSGSTVMSIQGSQGELFSITDSLSGSLFSVSNISGLPILEVFSDNTVLLGSYLDPMLITTQRLTANSGSTVIYSLPTASYDGVFVDYVIKSGSNARAGQFMGMWSGSSTNFTDNSTTDFGDTTGFIFGLIVSGSNMVLTGSASTSAWTVRAGIRSI